MMTSPRHLFGLAVYLTSGLFCSACGSDDNPSTEQNQDAGVSTDTERDASSGDAGSAPDVGTTADAGKPKAACQLLPAAEVSAILGTPQQATDQLSGAQCQYASLDPEKKNVRALLEVVTNGRAIYAANLPMQPYVLQSGIGDQAAFVSESVARSSMMSTVGDVLLRLNLGWGEPGAASETQLAGERTLMLSAIGRL
jgi:hypothetical protein